MGVHNAPRRVGVETAAGNRLATSTVAQGQEVDSQDASATNDSGSLPRDELALVEKVLGLVLAGVLPPRYKELISASIHLAPLRFHEGVSCCPPKKLLEWALADNIWVSRSSLLQLYHVLVFIHAYSLLSTFRAHTTR